MARHLGCPVGTVKSRVARGRERLRARLARRGIVPATALGLTLARGASAAVRPALVDATSRAAAQLAAGRGVVGLLAATVETLVRSEARRILMRHIWATTATLATAGVLMAGATLLGQQEAPGDHATVHQRLASLLAGQDRTTVVAAAPAGSTFVKVYSVADLLVGGGGRRGDVDMTPLVELITSTVTPGVWRVLDSHGGFVDNTDGSRSIMPSARDLTLIIRQTAEGHEQVAERVEQLRRVLSIRDANSQDLANPNAPAAPHVVVPPPNATQSGAMTQMMRAMGGQGQPGNSSSMGQMSGATNSQGQPGNSGRMSGMMGGQPGSQSSSNASSGGAALPSATSPMGQASNGAPGAPAGQQTTVYTYRQPMGIPSAVAPNQSGMPAGATAYDLAIATTPAGVANRTARPEPETERRLRSLEEKLDRVLKALDVPKADTPKGPLPR